MQKISGEIKQCFLIMSSHVQTWGTIFFYFPISSYKFILDDHRESLLSLISLSFLPVPYSSPPPFLFSLSHGSWCHSGLPGKVKAPGMMFLAPSWWLWLPRVYQAEEGKEPSQWKGQKTSLRHACLPEWCDFIGGLQWPQETGNDLVHLLGSLCSSNSPIFVIS